MLSPDCRIQYIQRPRALEHGVIARCQSAIPTEGIHFVVAPRRRILQMHDNRERIAQRFQLYAELIDRLLSAPFGAINPNQKVVAVNPVRRAYPGHSTSYPAR